MKEMNEMKSVELYLDYGCESELDDSDIHTIKSTNADAENSEEEIEQNQKLVQALQRMKPLRLPVLETRIIIFDRNTYRLQCLNLRDKTVTQMHEYNNLMKRKPFTSVCLRDHVFILAGHSMYKLKYRDVQAKWEQMADLIVDHGFHPPAVVASGEIIVAGAAGLRSTRSVTKFDPLLNKWKELNSKRYDTDGSTNVVAHEHVYCIGGRKKRKKVLSKVERLNLSSKTWNRVASMRIARYDASSVEWEKKLIVVGGVGDEDQFFNSVESYDQELNQWTIIKPILKARRSPWLKSHVINNSVYVVGPDDKGIEKYDSEKDKWELIQFPASVGFRVRGSVAVKFTE